MAWKILLLVALLLLIFGKGKFSELMGDVAKGIKSFRKGLVEDDDEATISMKPAPALDTSRPAPEAARKEGA
ncbi:twin-arginine translocase TatA/TatE family subunit [Emcibacter sp. SYSU 3D8]|uniref:twin-arginine translocase TatA/TatE family subunit n=1 Tax=Emcibacter sp. SYSU 3D8 TaxID=3133969 RepID=UPI0031FE5435